MNWGVCGRWELRVYMYVLMYLDYYYYYYYLTQEGREGLTLLLSSLELELEKLQKDGVSCVRSCILS